MKHPRRLVAVLTTLAVAGAVAVVGVRLQQGAAAPGGQAVAVKAKPGVDTAARKQQINKLLSARAAAVRKGDVKAFIAAVDGKDKKLVARQRMLFSNLRQFGFVKLEYSLA